MTWIWQGEGWPGVNSGIMYFQNAGKNGFTQYVLVEEVLRVRALAP